nr:unnamed protein product [Callosobruchus chinensis]
MPPESISIQQSDFFDIKSSIDTFFIQNPRRTIKLKSLRISRGFFEVSREVVTASQVILKDFYVDDLSTGGDALEYLIQLRHGIDFILKDVGLASKVPTNNRFSPLITEVDHSQKNAVQKIPKPPAIFVYGIMNFPQMVKKISEIVPEEQYIIENTTYLAASVTDELYTAMDHGFAIQAREDQPTTFQPLELDDEKRAAKKEKEAARRN